MGLLLTKEEARLEELKILIDEAWEQYRGLGPAAAAEKAAGIPPVAGTNQALRAAALEYAKQLYDERNATYKRRGVFRHCCGWGSLRVVTVVEWLLLLCWQRAPVAFAGGREGCCVRRRPRSASVLGACAYL